MRMKKRQMKIKKFNYIVSNPPFKLDFSDDREDLDTEANKERFFAGIPNIPNKDKDKMAIVIGLKTAAAFDGDICTLDFKVNDNAVEGSTSTVNATSILKNGSNVISSKVTPGVVTVRVQLLGDIDGNESVDIDDAVLLFQHSMLPDIFPISYVGNVDFDKNGTVLDDLGFTSITYTSSFSSTMNCMLYNPLIPIPSPNFFV